ncbi:MAG: glycosyltransferase [Acidimicrobiales bacterium]
MTRATPTTFAVVVPAHNEASSIAACVRSIAWSAAHPAIGRRAVELTVVLDTCDDTTGERAEAAIAEAQGRLGGSFSGRVTESNHTNVGRTRALGVATALKALDGVDPNTIWVACTDADSMVPHHWLAHQAALYARGFEAVAGTVAVRSWEFQPSTVRRLHQDHYHRGGGATFGHRHVHGTNLGLSGWAYEQAGGFAPLATGEDHELWRALRAARMRCVSTPGAAVTTSARPEGRAPAGFAGFLRDLRRRR